MKDAGIAAILITVIMIVFIASLLGFYIWQRKKKTVDPEDISDDRVINAGDETSSLEAETLSNVEEDSAEIPVYRFDNRLDEMTNEDFDPVIKEMIAREIEKRKS